MVNLLRRYSKISNNLSTYRMVMHGDIYEPETAQTTFEHWFGIKNNSIILPINIFAHECTECCIGNGEKKPWWPAYMTAYCFWCSCWSKFTFLLCSLKFLTLFFYFEIQRWECVSQASFPHQQYQSTCFICFREAGIFFQNICRLNPYHHFQHTGKKIF